MKRGYAFWLAKIARQPLSDGVDASSELSPFSTPSAFCAAISCWCACSWGVGPEWLAAKVGATIKERARLAAAPRMRFFMALLLSPLRNSTQFSARRAVLCGSSTVVLVDFG